MTVRVAMLGAGAMARKVHFPSLASFSDVEIVAVCDLDPARLNDAADAYGIRGRYADYRAMVERERPDAVFAVGPPHVLYDAWVWLLHQGVNLFIEKPLGITMHQADMLAWLAEEHGCITQVGFQRRTTPATVAMREACLRHGPIEHAIVRFYKHEFGPKLTAWDRVLDDATHAIDTLRWLCGGDLIDLQVRAARHGVPDINFLTTTLAFDTGATGQAHLNWCSGRRIFSIDLHARGVAAEIDTEGDVVLFEQNDATGVRTSSQALAGSDEFFIFGGFQAKDREFIDAVRDRALPSSHFGDARRTMEIVHRILATITLAGI